MYAGEKQSDEAGAARYSLQLSAVSVATAICSVFLNCEKDAESTDVPLQTEWSVCRNLGDGISWRQILRRSTIAFAKLRP